MQGQSNLRSRLQQKLPEQIFPQQTNLTQESQEWE